MVTGIETTALTINWALHELGKNKHMQEKLRQKVLDSQGRNSGDVTSNGEDQQKLSYLDAFCKETQVIVFKVNS